MHTTPDLASLSDQIDALSESLSKHRTELQQVEASLVTRIADVDDDRRITSNRLQRAWQTQREEVDAKLRRQNSLFLGSSLLLAALFAIVLGVTYVQGEGIRETLNDQRATLERDRARSTSVTAADLSDLQVALERLRVETLTQIGDLSAELTRVGTDLGQIQGAVAQDEVLRERLGALTLSVAAISEAIARDGERLDAMMARLDAGDPTATLAPGIDSNPGDDALQRRPSQTGPGTPVGKGEDEQAGTNGRTDEAEDAPPGSDPGAAADRAPDQTTRTRADAEVTSASQDTDRGATPGAETRADQAPQTNSAATAAADQRIDSKAGGVDLPADQGSDSSAEATATPDLDSNPPAPDDYDRVVVGDSPYALQLIGFYSLDSLVNFAREASLPDTLYFREETYQGRPWFVLIHSLHPLHALAAQANQDLPPELATLDTWIRNFPPNTELGVLKLEARDES